MPTTLELDSRLETLLETYRTNRDPTTAPIEMEQLYELIPSMKADRCVLEQSSHWGLLFLSIYCLFLLIMGFSAFDLIQKYLGRGMSPLYLTNYFLLWRVLWVFSLLQCKTMTITIYLTKRSSYSVYVQLASRKTKILAQRWGLCL